MSVLRGFLFILIIALIATDRTYYQSEQIKSDVDGRSYEVVSKYDDKQRAADIIAEINGFAITVVNTLQQKYMGDTDPDISPVEATKGREIAGRIIGRYNPNSITENEPESPDTTSYTKGKGDLISLCLREKNTGQNTFHEMHLIKFVMLHEMAHIVTHSYNHVEEFWINFKFLLQFCHKYGLYDPIDYSQNPVIYCGLNVAYNPFFNPNIISYIL